MLPIASYMTRGNDRLGMDGGGGAELLNNILNVGHVEATRDTVPNWAKLPEYENSDDPAFQKENINRLTRDVEANLTDINAVARGVGTLNLIAPAADKSLSRSAAP